MKKNYRNVQADSLETIKNKTQASKGRIYPSVQSMQLTALENSNRNKIIQQDYFQDYKPANYKKSVKYMNQHSYKRKLMTGQYEQIQFFSHNSELKQFGIGIYLYLQFFRRTGWVFLILAILEALPIYLNYQGSGLSSYSLSYGTYLIKTTLGNYSNKITNYDGYLETGIHCLTNLIFFFYFLNWKIHNHNQIEDYENDNNIVHPKKFCVEIEGFPKKGVTNKELQIFFSNFGPIYQCSLVYNYKDKLRYFKSVDEIDQNIKQQQLQIRLGDGDKKNLQKLKKRKNQIVNQINSIKISPSILSAYVHFQFQKSKLDLLKYYNDRYLFDTKLHQCVRSICCCCIDQVDQAHRFHQLQLKIKNQKVPDPAQINWESIDITPINKLFRVIIAILVVIIFLAICSTLVALCSIFIATNSMNCNGVEIPIFQVANITTNQTLKKCYCNSNLFQFNNQTIYKLCGPTFQKLYIQNGLQIGAALISTITNFLFAILIDKIIDFTKPESLSSGLSTKTFILFIFLLINTCILPLLLFADIFNFKIASYVSFMNLIIPNSEAFNTNSLQYYSDFSSIWYRNVSPYFTNYIIINIFVIWMKYIYYTCSNNRRISNLEDQQGKILQMHMNKRIVSFQVSVVEQTAEILLIIFISFMYNAGVPILIPLATINIVSRYIINKSLILKYSSKIDGLTESFGEVVVNVVPICLIISSLVGIWMLTGTYTISSNTLSVNIPGTQTWQQIFILFPRLFYITFTLMMAILVIGYLLLYNTLIRFFSWLGSLCYQAKQVSDKKVIQFSHAAKTLNILKSYNIHSNDKYKNTIINLQRYLQLE